MGPSSEQMRSDLKLILATAALLLGVLPLVAAHDDNGGMDMDMDMGRPDNETMTVSAEEEVMTYFRYAHHSGWIYAHTTLMIIAWAGVMPMAVMLSVARSRYHLPAQVLFHLVNGLGIFTGFVYNHSTPDLYRGNSHHAIGWVVTSFTIVWTVMSLFVAYGEYKSKRRTASHLVSAQSMAAHTRFRRYSDYAAPRYSRDSGHGTERNSDSLRHSREGSQDSLQHKPEDLESPLQDVDMHDDNDDAEPEKHSLLGNNRIDRFISQNVRRLANPRASKIIRFSQIVLEKSLLLLGFLAITTGFVVWGGLFRGRAVFSGLAHFIKGGLFFWYGLIILGRWMGAFSEFGWAWNVRPQFPLVSRWKSRVPSAEFVESFILFAYGTSNVFLEHLNAWGKAWTPMDFEHVSITILFFGGGLLGMLIESSWARELMNSTVVLQKKQEEEVDHFQPSALGVVSGDQPWNQPKTYNTSLNPMPALLIMILGIMMSSHHQSNMVSTMMHSQWGMLFSASAMARAVTYIILYITPPTSHFPARPPSELVAAFCLTSGGLMFMMSARDCVDAIIHVGLDAMTIFTVTLGLSAAIMAWEVVVFALKGWAVRKEHAAAGRPLS